MSSALTGGTTRARERRDVERLGGGEGRQSLAMYFGQSKKPPASIALQRVHTEALADHLFLLFGFTERSSVDLQI